MKSEKVCMWRRLDFHSGDQVCAHCKTEMFTNFIYILKLTYITLFTYYCYLHHVRNASNITCIP